MKPRSRLDNRGQGLTEYLILLLLIAVASIAATKSLGKEIKSNIDQAKRNIRQGLTLKDSKDSSPKDSSKDSGDEQSRSILPW